MNWGMIATVIASLTLMVTLFGVVFIGGKLTQQVQDNTVDIRDLRKEHCDRLDDHDDQLNAHDVSLGRLHEWKDGFNAGARKVGSGEARD
jgi:hypothetical protein